MLEIKGVCKKAGDFALRDISLKVAQGDYFALLGVSGSGKSMLLELIAGLRKTDSGQILLEGMDITNTRIQKRGTGIVFQDSAVFPHMSVYDNIAFPLKSRAVPQKQIAANVEKWAQHTGISSLLQRRPGKLSGGELRRVALARTLAMNPKILLLDEPLSSLDVLLQYDMMRLLSIIHEEGQTVVHVTHDYHEAYALATRLAVMQGGRILQQGTPDEVFSKPMNAFVAGLTGIKNYFQCLESTTSDNQFLVRFGQGITLVAAQPVGANAFFYIREEDISINNELGHPNQFSAVIAGIFPFPGGADILLDAGFLLHAHISNERWSAMNLGKGGKVSAGFSAEAVFPV